MKQTTKTPLNNTVVQPEIYSLNKEVYTFTAISADISNLLQFHLKRSPKLPCMELYNFQKSTNPISSNYLPTTCCTKSVRTYYAQGNLITVHHMKQKETAPITSKSIYCHNVTESNTSVLSYKILHAYHRRLSFKESQHSWWGRCFGNSNSHIINGWNKWTHMIYCCNKTLKETQQ